MKKTSSHKQPAIAACAFEIQPGKDRIQLFPVGKFRAVDGRPAECANWYLDEKLANSLISALASRTNPVVIDYEHQTLRTEQNGKPAPAAGWINPQSLTWTPDGLFADVTWTARAKELIQGGEYRFISPVFCYDRQSGAITKFIHAALTNDPGLDGMSEVTLAAASRLAAHNPVEEEFLVNEELLKLLRQLLGLAADADEAAITAALEKMLNEIKTDAGENANASLSTVFSTLKTKKEEVAALTVALDAAKKTPPGAPDPAKYAPVSVLTELQQQVASLSARVNGGELDTLVADALNAGKLLPALEPWARELGEKDIAALKSYIDKAAPIAALTSQQSGGQPPTGGNNHGLNATELSVAALSGMTAEEFATAKKSLENN